MCVGSLDRDPAFAARSAPPRRGRAGWPTACAFAGPADRRRARPRYAAADLLVLASRGETYGMVVTEALARGLPVVAAEVGGVPEALGHGAGGARPGLLVPPDDPAALGRRAAPLARRRRLRGRLRRAARERRDVAARLVDDHVGRSPACSPEAAR